MAETLYHRGTLEGHTGWVTSIATPLDPNSDTILSSSRWVPTSDECLMVACNQCIYNISVSSYWTSANNTCDPECHICALCFLQG